MEIINSLMKVDINLPIVMLFETITKIKTF